MTPLEIGVAGFAVLGVLIYAGVHISTALLLVAFADLGGCGAEAVERAQEADPAYQTVTAPISARSAGALPIPEYFEANR